MRAATRASWQAWRAAGRRPSERGLLGLTAVEQQVLFLRLHCAEPSSAVAERLGLTVREVQRTQCSALRKLAADQAPPRSARRGA